MSEFYRIAEDGNATGYGPYTTVGVARNAASNIYGGKSWRNLNSQVIPRTVYKYEMKDVTYSIQKLTPVLRQHPAGAFVLGLEWMDLDG